MASSNLGKKELIWLTWLHHRPSQREIKAGTQAVAVVGTMQRLLTCLFSCLRSARFLMQPSQVHLPRDGATHQYQSSTKKMTHRLVHGSIWLEMIPWLRLPLPRWLQLVSSWSPPPKKALSITIKMKMGRRKYSWSVHRIQRVWLKQTHQPGICCNKRAGRCRENCVRMKDEW